MKEINRALVLATAGLSLLLSTASQAALVSYDPAALLGNFGAPGTVNHNVAYTTSASADATFAYFGVTACPDLGGELGGLDFANIYISTIYPEGSTIGFELGNNRAFVPGVPGYYENISADGIVITHSVGEWNVAIPWAFLQNDPRGMGFNRVTEANNKVTLNLSQAFGYSVAGGLANYGSDRLGLAEMAVVPEPTTMIAGALLLVPLGVGAWRKSRKA